MSATRVMKEHEGESRVNGGAINIKIIIAVGVVIIAVLSVLGAINYNNAKLLRETPLTETAMWYSLDNFPEYKLEAAKEVKQLMAEGVDQEEACQTALDKICDKIYLEQKEKADNSVQPE